MLGRTNTGGGGTSLNFKVVGNPKPENPKENTICIDTDTPISGWTFSATVPDDPMEGMVWITVGASSTVEFNALKKNGIQVYPLSAKQYVSGAWADKTAKSYQGGAWVDWIQYLYNAGDTCAEITGGWTSATGNYAITFGTSYIQGTVTATSARTATVYTVNKVDVSKYTRVCAQIEMSTNNDQVILGVTTTTPTHTTTTGAATKSLSKETGAHTLSVDISSITDGAYYVFLYTAQSNYICRKIWLE